MNTEGEWMGCVEGRGGGRMVGMRYLVVVGVIWVMGMVAGCAGGGGGGGAVSGVSGDGKVLGVGQGEMSYLDNGKVRVGVDLGLGGAMTYLARVGGEGGMDGGDGAAGGMAGGVGENLINSYDWGRQVQMSHYGGPVPFVKGGKEPVKHWAGLGWNPIQSGDFHGNRSKVLEHWNDGKTLYVKCVPMQWPMDNVPGECTFEWWITLEGNVVRVRSRFVNDRPDRTKYPAKDQELPAVYTNGKWYRVVTYLGDQPFAGEAVTVMTRKGEKAGWPWLKFVSAEGWVGLVDEGGSGVGIVHPEVRSFAAGFAGEDGQKGGGGVRDAQTGYVSPVTAEMVDYNVVLENRFDLVVGSVEEIRAHAVRVNGDRGKPVFRFAKDRQHWTLVKATDGGFPVKGELRIDSPKPGGMLVSPAVFWRAEGCPVLYVEAAFGGGVKEASVSFRPFTKDDRRGWDQWGEGARKAVKWSKPVKFAVKGDGKMRVYRVELAGEKGYEGAMLGLRLGLPETGKVTRVRSIGFEGGEGK